MKKTRPYFLLPLWEKEETKRPRSKPGPDVVWTAKPKGLLVAVLERGAEDVAQRCSRIGGAILRNGFLLFGDFQRLDRDLHLAGLLVELDHAGIDLFADGETLSALIVAIAGEFRPLDEGGEV